MRAGKGVDAVDLNETEVFKHAIKVSTRARPRIGSEQQMPVQKQASGTLIVEKRKCHPAMLSPILRKQFKVRFEDTQRSEVDNHRWLLW